MTRRTISVFSLSFLDLFSCALAAVIVLMLVFITMMEGNRSDRRRMIFTARISIEAAAGGAADGLFGGANWHPADWVEVFLVDPNGFEKGLELIPDGSAAYVNYSSARPAFGEWSVRIRPLDRPRRNRSGGSSIEIPTSLRSWNAAFKEIDKVETSPEWLLDPIDDLIDDLLEERWAGRPPHLVAWEIATRLDRFLRLRSDTASYSAARPNPRKWLRRLANTLVSKEKITSFKELSNPFLEKSKLFDVQAVALYDRLYQLLHYDQAPPHQQEVALAMMAAHLRSARLDGGDRIILQCQIADLLRPWEQGVHSNVCHKMRKLLSGLPLAINGDNGGDIHVRFNAECGLEFLKQKTKSTNNDSLNRLDEWLVDSPDGDLSRLVRLARTQKVKIKISNSSEARIYLASTTGDLQKAMVAVLEKSDDLEDTVVPALFVGYHLRNVTKDGKLAHLLRSSLESPNRARNLVLAAEELPSLYLSARGAAIASRETTIRIRDLLVHWGSEMQRAPDDRKDAFGLSVDEPILRFGIYPAEVVLRKDEG